MLVDCVGTPLVRLKQANIDPLSVTDLFLTHFHPDHVSGVPNFLMSSWLLGRTGPLTLYGLPYTLERLEALMDFYGWKRWPRFFPVHFQPLPAEELTPVMGCAEYKVFASPVHHLIPTLGLRVEMAASGRVLAYSCDTEPCAEVVRLAAGADLLVHESSGLTRGHSSARQAGDTGRQAEVGRMLLIHYPVGSHDPSRLPGEAHSTFGGPVALAEDFMEVDL
jgi:ribonuclease Z